jgi:para-aminobenzoate synthetase component 1
MLRLELPWREPPALARALAAAHGTEGLVWLDGDGSRLGGRGLLAAAPRQQICCRGRPGDAGSRDPFDALAELGRSGGTWLGWLGYEAAAWVEPGDHWQASDMASLWAARHDPVLQLDLRRRRLWLEGSDPARNAALAALVKGVAPAVGDEGGDADAGTVPLRDWRWHSDGDAYAAGVERIRAWITAGDLFQANLSACCEQELAADPDPLALYGRLRRRCPAPFAGLAIAGGEARGEAVLSASPERFLRLSPAGEVETRPIKGTRPRHTDPDRDAAAAAELVCSPKDRAENVMIVDLLRNDLGRVCEPGSIHVPQLVGLESYPQVHHLTSVVLGRLRSGVGAAGLLRACWPGGSVTGAPKVRACRRLNELEPLARGPYCGSLFRLDADGGLDSSILIRSAMLRGRRLRIHAGGGIVADSDPHQEALEMGWKIRPLLEALANHEGAGAGAGGRAAG